MTMGCLTGLCCGRGRMGIWLCFRRGFGYWHQYILTLQKILRWRVAAYPRIGFGLSPMTMLFYLAASSRL